MVTQNRVKKVVNQLKKAGRVQKNKLIRSIVEERLMSHQTASDAIGDAVKANRIFRQEDVKGKQKIVWLSVYENVQKAEDAIKRKMEIILNKFDSQYQIFEKKYPELSIENKIDSIDALLFLLRRILLTIEHLHEAYQKTRYWDDLLTETRIGRVMPFRELAKLETEENVTQISLNLISYKFDDIDSSFDDVEEYLGKLK